MCPSSSLHMFPIALTQGEGKLQVFRTGSRDGSVVTNFSAFLYRSAGNGTILGLTRNKVRTLVR